MMRRPPQIWNGNFTLKSGSGQSSLLVRSTALIALGENALFPGNLALGVVLPEMKRLENDTAPGPFVEDALDNIRVAKIRPAT
jgi:hypothetical protein